MRYFWHFFIVVCLLAVMTGVFFAFSLSTKDKIDFTDDDTITAPEITIADPSLGPNTAPVTLVDYGDYQCPACAQLETSLAALQGAYGDSLRIVWKDMPNTSSHPEALNAALAAQCAGEQKKFWEYHTALMQNQANLNPELYTEIATSLNLKDHAFANCLDNQTTLPFVERDFKEGVALGIAATPTVYINGVRYTGAMTTTDLKRIIDQVIASL